MKLHVSYADKKTTVKVQADLVDIKPFQIIVWISISSERFTTWDPAFPRLPAILDIGNNHNFAISEEHLFRWAGIQSASLHELKNMREKGRRIRLRSASLWLHSDVAPLLLDIEDGIAIYDTDGPRLPTLGLRALTSSRLQTFIDGNSKQVVLRTPPAWYWPF